MDIYLVLSPFLIKSDCSSFDFMHKIPWLRPMSRLAMERQPYRRGDRLTCIKRERTVFSMHSYEARPKALHEYMKRQCAQLGASSLACRSCMKCLVVFRRNDLLALMLNCLSLLCALCASTFAQGCGGQTGGLCGGTLPAYNPFTELFQFLSFSVSRSHKVWNSQLYRRQFQMNEIRLCIFHRFKLRHN